MGDSEIIIGLVVLVAIYVLPTIVAFARRHPNRWVILALNICLGGTGIVWLGCLIWAFMAVHITNDPNGTNGGESGLNLTANDVVRLRIEPPYPVATPSHPPLPSEAAAAGERLHRLERLQRLRADNVIDQRQFERMRDEIVDQRS